MQDVEMLAPVDRDCPLVFLACSFAVIRIRSISKLFDTLKGFTLKHVYFGVSPTETSRTLLRVNTYGIGLHKVLSMDGLFRLISTV